MSTTLSAVQRRDLKRVLRQRLQSGAPIHTLHLSQRELSYLVDAATAYQPDHRDAPEEPIEHCPTCGKAFPNEDPICPVCD